MGGPGVTLRIKLGTVKPDTVKPGCTLNLLVKQFVLIEHVFGNALRIDFKTAFSNCLFKGGYAVVIDIG